MWKEGKASLTLCGFIELLQCFPCSPYDGKWSKTMIGYGPEDNHFVCELTYNYGVSQYEMGITSIIHLFI